MVLRTTTKDENVPGPRTLIMVAARDGCARGWLPLSCGSEGPGQPAPAGSSSTGYFERSPLDNQV